MKTPIVRHEHDEIASVVLLERAINPVDLAERINEDTNRILPGKINLLQCELRKGHLWFSTYFRIGAEWLDKDKTQSLVVLPKKHDPESQSKKLEIDFLSMFMTCLRSPACLKTFSSIYEIDLESKPIRSEALNSVLSPLLIVHFLKLVGLIASSGLKKGYINRSSNLGKVKGRINIRENERRNIVTGHHERVFCDYQEFSVDIPENRILKKALGFARVMLDNMGKHRIQPQLRAMLNSCLAAFEEVGDDIEPWQISSLKVNKIYRLYTDAIRLAKIILRRYDYAIQKVSTTSAEVPPFCIDMALLFEHYAYALLHEAYSDAVQYQVKGYGGNFIADFLFDNGREKAVLDTKYKYKYNSKPINKDDVMQLSGYARSIDLLKKIGIAVHENSPVPDVPCLILYPRHSTGEISNPFMGKSLSSFLQHHQKGIVRFYMAAINVPCINLEYHEA